MLKCVQFTNGTKLAVFADPSATLDYDDLIQMNGYEMFFYSLQNAFITAGLPLGGFLNSGLSRTELEDKDGNTWKFEQTSSDNMRLTITKPDSTTVVKDMPRADGNQPWFYYLVCTETDEGYELHLGSARPVNSETRSTTGQNPYLQVSYIEGVSAGGYNFYEDISSIWVSEDPGGYGHSATNLRNNVEGSPFVSITGYYLPSPEQPDQPAFYVYTYPRGIGVLDSQPLINLTDSITDADVLVPDPYEPGGISEEDGGGGDHDNTGDTIDFPPLPTISAVDTGFITLYNPNLGQLQNLASYMWSSAFDLDTFRKLVADPMDCILGLSIVPVSVPNGAQQAVSIGNIATNVNMTKAAAQYVEVPCGSLTVKEYWGSYLDYSPYTKAQLYLPYIGIHDISIDDIMNKTITIMYHVDILSGACTAYVKCGNSVLYSFIGQCSFEIPVSEMDWSNVISAAINISGSIGSMAASGGSTAPSTIASAASTAVNNLKPNIEKSGAMSGTGGFLGIQNPYLILTRPRQALPASQNMFMGYPSFITEFLGSLTGYTEIESIHLENIPGTQQELDEIESILKNGVIF